MRGKVDSKFFEIVKTRITPAHAGKRPAWLPSAPPSTDHPRACGEKVPPCVHASFMRGSPPRMRGKDMDACVARWPARITPAHAGKSDQARFGRSSGWDHPRACGEKGGIAAGSDFPVGSPPRMRGKEAKSNVCGSQTGITPAHAGKSRQRDPQVSRNGDHPRACGEKLDGPTDRRRVKGSPPRMRGKAKNRPVLPCMSRITPAHAGKRAGAKISADDAWDHPRACGEKFSALVKPK